MTPPAVSSHGYRLPPEVISHVVSLYRRVCRSFRGGEGLLAERDVTAHPLLTPRIGVPDV